MPTQYIQKIANKTGKSVKTLEKYWEEAKTSVNMSSTHPGYWGTVTKIFKAKIGKHLGLKESLVMSYLIEKRSITSSSKKDLKALIKTMKTKEFKLAAKVYTRGLTIMDVEKAMYRDNQSSLRANRQNLNKNMDGLMDLANLMGDLDVDESQLKEELKQFEQVLIESNILNEGAIFNMFKKLILGPFQTAWKVISAELSSYKPEVIFAYITIKYPRTMTLLIRMFIAITGPIGVILSGVSSNIRETLKNNNMQRISESLIQTFHFVESLIGSKKNESYNNFKKILESRFK